MHGIRGRTGILFYAFFSLFPVIPDTIGKFSRNPAITVSYELIIKFNYISGFQRLRNQRQNLQLAGKDSLVQGVAVFPA